MDTKALLQTLTAAPGVSGDERGIAEAAKEWLAKYGEVRTDALGSVICTVKGGGKRKILLDAHMDQVGLIVLEITPDGFLRAAPCGGIDRRTLAACDVTVYGKTPLYGVITSTPPHLLSGDDAGKVPETILVDIGMTAEQAKAQVCAGDRIALRSEFRQLAGDCVSAPALDDRAGLCVLLEALEQLKAAGCTDDLTVVFSVLEETTEGGARAAAFSAEADLCLAVDVTFAKTPDEKEEETGTLGGGPMVGFAPSLSRAVSVGLQKTAERCGIPYQVEVMGGLSGTNADAMAAAAGGVRTGLVSVPLRYMHTGVEVVSATDVENSARLLAEFILREATELC